MTLKSVQHTPHRFFPGRATLASLGLPQNAFNRRRNAASTHQFLQKGGFTNNPETGQREK